jgi:hypothetical protein
MARELVMTPLHNLRRQTHKAVRAAHAGEQPDRTLVGAQQNLDWMVQAVSESSEASQKSTLPYNPSSAE